MEVIKLNDLDRWGTLKGKQSLHFGANKMRDVRLQLNCPAPTQLTIIRDTGEISPLVVVPMGLSVLTFAVQGQFDLTADWDVQYLTAEHEPTHIEVLDPVVFTKIAHRRSRNPELEQMMFMMNQNIERRLAAADAEYERRIKEISSNGDNGRVHVEAAAQRRERGKETNNREPVRPAVGGGPAPESASPASPAKGGHDAGANKAKAPTG